MENKEIRPIRLLLVDDDIQIRPGLEKIIRNHFSESELTIISCENGLIASQILAQESIDILITDIKMPVCSGIELLEIIKQKNYHCQSIVLSGYDDFNLVKNAMRFGASDYLLKPVDEGLLIHAIKEMSKTIEREALPVTHATSPSSVLHMQRLLESFMETSVFSDSDFQQFKELNDIDSHTYCAACYVDIQRALYSNQLTLLQFLADCACTFLDSSESKTIHNIHGVYGGIGSFWILLIFSPSNAVIPDKILESFFSVLEQGHFKYTYTSAWYNCTTLHQAASVCQKGFEKYYFDLPYTNFKYENPTESLSGFWEQAAVFASAYNYAQTIEYLERCFALINLLRPSIEEVKKQMNQFIYCILSKNTAFIPVISASKFTDYDILEQIENAESLSILQKNVYCSINHFIGEMVNSMADKDDYVIQKAKLYIQNNYKEDLSLNDVSTHVFLNSNYFSTLFKAKTGITFRNYLRDYRIEKAKELLTSTNLRIYEIALSVGYTEHSHFVRAFKDVTNQSPTEYRENHTIK